MTVKDFVSGILLIVVITIIVIVVVGLGSVRADAQCLTKAEARARWPTAHLFWHGPKRCWDNQSRNNKHKPHIAPEPIQLRGNIRAEASTKSAKLKGRIDIFYPQMILTQTAIVNDLIAIHKPITEWPLMLDIDATGPDPDNGIDGCCWPPIESLPATGDTAQ